MSPEVIAIVSVGVGLAALILSGQRSLRTEIQAIRAELTTEIRSLRAEVHALAERVARLEGAVPFLTPRTPRDPEKPAAQVSA